MSKWVVLRNFADTVDSVFKSIATVARTYTLKDRDGTLLDDTDLNGTAVTDRALNTKIPLQTGESITPTHILEDLLDVEASDVTLALTDAFRVKELTKGSAGTVTFPGDSQVAIPVGTWGYMVRTGAGQYSFVAGNGSVTITTSKGANTDPGANALFRWRKSAANTFYVDNGLPVSITLADVTGALGYTPSKRILYAVNNVSAPTDGTTNEILLASVTFTAGDIQANDRILVRAACTKTGSAGAYNIRFRLHTANQLSGSTQIGIHSPGATQLWTPMIRSIQMVNSVSAQEVFPSTTNAANDESAATNAPTALTFNFASTVYLLISINCVNAADIGRLRGYSVEVIR